MKLQTKAKMFRRKIKTKMEFQTKTQQMKTNSAKSKSVVVESKISQIYQKGQAN